MNVFNRWGNHRKYFQIGPIQCTKHYHLEVRDNPKKIVQKNTILFLASMGETGLSHEIFFKFSFWPSDNPVSPIDAC